MNCPICGSDEKTEVCDSRITNEWIRRRRRCPICNEKFTTVEITYDDYEKITSEKKLSDDLFDLIERRIKQKARKIS